MKNKQMIVGLCMVMNFMLQSANKNGNGGGGDEGIPTESLVKDSTHLSLKSLNSLELLDSA